VVDAIRRDLRRGEVTYGHRWAAQWRCHLSQAPRVVDSTSKRDPKRRAGLPWWARTAARRLRGITIGAGVRARHAMRTDSGAVGFKIGEHERSATPPAGQALAKVMTYVARTKLTTNLGRAMVRSRDQCACMANHSRGALACLGSSEVAHRAGKPPRLIAIHVEPPRCPMSVTPRTSVADHTIEAQRGASVGAAPGQGSGGSGRHNWARASSSLTGVPPSMLQA